MTIQEAFEVAVRHHQAGQLAEAEAIYRQILAADSRHAQAWQYLGVIAHQVGRHDAAVDLITKAIGLAPGVPDFHSDLGEAYRAMGRLDEAIAAYRQAIALRPEYAEAYSNLGNVLKENGQVEEAVTAFRHAIALKPGDAQIHSNLVFNLHYHPGSDARQIAEENRCWNRQHAMGRQKGAEVFVNDPNPTRRLRIGYISPDFRDHVVGRYIMPLFERHDHTQFEVFCYSGVQRPDERTARFQSLADQWQSTLGMEDQQVAERIREDGVDILVDLSQHTAGNRLLVFARQPAPVQVSFAGYPASTGLEAVGYRISDRWLEGEILRGREGRPGVPHLPAMDASERPASVPYLGGEQLCLIESFWCYDPWGADVEVNGLPVLNNGCITFGSLNNFCKINERVLALWARVLDRVAGSRLMVLSFIGSHRERMLAALRQHGVDGSRLEFVEPRARREYLELYHHIDIGLETFPYNGHTTSLDAFWMGVPVVGLAGELPVSRAGLSNLMNLGLPELVARTEDEYVDLVAELAGDPSRLAQLRATLRDRMKGSVLMDAPRYAGQIEQAYRQMWRRWCGGGIHEPVISGGGEL